MTPIELRRFTRLIRDAHRISVNGVASTRAAVVLRCSCGWESATIMRPTIADLDRAGTMHHIDMKAAHLRMTSEANHPPAD
jgi:hypothetical protein